jgi:hypothetical protein
LVNNVVNALAHLLSGDGEQCVAYATQVQVDAARFGTFTAVVDTDLYAQKKNLLSFLGGDVMQHDASSITQGCSCKCSNFYLLTKRKKKNLVCKF